MLDNTFNKKESPLVGMMGGGPGGPLGISGGAAADKTYVDDVFSTFVYDGTDDGSAQTITNGIDLSGEGGLVWSKKRNSSAFPIWTDTERGVQKYLRSDNSNAETTNSGYVTQFNSDGYAIGGGGNINYGEMCSWTFRKQPGFFDIVTYTGASGNQDISHNLGSVPGMIIVKNLTQGTEWCVYHRSLGNGKRLQLQDTAAEETNSIYWPSAPTSTTFTVGNDASNGFTNWNYVAYIFAHDDQSFGTNSDESIIKCGSFTTDSNGFFTVDLGFEPQWLLYRRYDNGGSPGGGGSHWYMLDINRGYWTAEKLNWLKADSSGAETKYSYQVRPYERGFKSVVNAMHGGNQSMIYMAIRRPNKPPTAGTEVFKAVQTTSQPVSVGFLTDLIITAETAAGAKYWVPRLSENYLNSTSTGQESAGSSYFKFDQQNSFSTHTFWGSSQNINWYFRRAPGFFDVVAADYPGSSVAISHNLGVAPELIISKPRDGNVVWMVGSDYLSNTSGWNQYLEMHSNAAQGGTSTVWNQTAPTATHFTLGSYPGSSYKGIFYLFATLSGISKVGSYSGTGSNINVDCGFTAGARFVMIKRTDSTGDWYVWDSTRGIVSGNDPYLLLNTSAAQVTNTDYIDPLNAGFTVTSSAPTALNTSGGTYLFMAIA